MRKRPFSFWPILHGLWFTGALAWPQTALADRVVVLPTGGEAAEELRQDLEDALMTAVSAAGHEPLSDAGADPSAETAPATFNELQAIGEMQRAQYVLVSNASGSPSRIRLSLRVAYLTTPRVEELEVTVLEANQAQRLRDVMTAMLRAEGLGDDAARLSAEPEVSPVDEERLRQEEERARQAAEEERARQEFARREQERVEQARQTEQQRWEGREQYGTTGGSWMFNAGVDLRPILGHDSARQGGVLGGVSGRVGYAIASVPGLELRGAFDLITGVANAFSLTGGAVFLASPWIDPHIFIGGGADVGWFQALSGSRDAGLVVRASPVIGWHAIEPLFLEAALPELMIVTSSGGVVTVGLSIRAGTRF